MNTRRKPSMIHVLPIAMLFVCTVLPGMAIAKNTFDWRMVILPSLNFQSSDHVQQAIDFLPRMKAADYNGLFLDSHVMKKLHTQKAMVKADVQRLVAAAGQNGITIIPMSQGQGGNAFHDQSLQEAFPNEGTPFLVGNGVALPKGDPGVRIKNGGFEEGTTGWRIGAPNWKLDETVKRTGNASMRCDDPVGNYIRINQNVALKPYRTYELSMWVKTQNIASAGTRPGDKKCKDVAFTIQSPAGNYIYSNRYFRNGLGVNTNWKLLKIYFHSLDRHFAQIDVQATRGNHYTGQVWYDDIEIKEMGLVETVIRENLGVVVKTTAGTVLSEGKDYTIGTGRLVIPAGSAAREGDVLLVSWFKEANVVASGANAPFCYQDVWVGARQEIWLEDDWFGTPPAKLMKYSEWRLAGWDPVCVNQYQINEVGSGKYMSAVANMTAALYKEINGSREAVVYNDAFDPYHNSRSSYYVVNGGSVGSGYGLSNDIIVLNWCAWNRKESLKFFAGTEGKNRPGWGVKTSKQRQIISSAVGVGAWNDWMQNLKAAEDEGKLPDGSVIGMAYHTYKPFPSYYDQIEGMVQVAKDAGRWGTGPISFPAPTPGIPVQDLPGIEQAAPVKALKELALSARATHTRGIRALRFTVGDNNSVHLGIYNLQGRLVSRLVSEQLSAGSYERTMDFSNLSSGIYVAKLTVDGKQSLSHAVKIASFE